MITHHHLPSWAAFDFLETLHSVPESYRKFTAVYSQKLLGFLMNSAENLLNLVAMLFVCVCVCVCVCVILFCKT